MAIDAFYGLHQRNASIRLPFRPMEGRIVGFSYGSWATPIAEWSDSSRSAAGAMAARIHLGTDGQHIASSRSAIAQLVAGSPAATVAQLERLSGSTPANAIVWSDLAAARYEAARATHDGELMTLALDASDRAIELNPSLAEALFNRAVIIEGLGLRSAAVEAWR